MNSIADLRSGKDPISYEHSTAFRAKWMLCQACRTATAILLVVCICARACIVHGPTWQALPCSVAECQGCASRSRQRRKDIANAAVAAVYARYSSEQQDVKSIADQVRECRDEAMRDGIEVGENLIFADEAISGTIRDRPGLNQLLEAARQRRFSTLYFYSLSRLAREFVISMPMLKELVYVHQVRVICKSDGIDTSQPGWELHAIFACLQSEHYIKELSANVRRGLIGTVLSRYSVGDYVFGYKSVPSPDGATIGHGKTQRRRMAYAIEPSEAEWVRCIFRWYVVDRRPIGWIVRELNKHSVPKDHRSSTPNWRHPNVIRILRSSKYIGLWSWGRMKNRRNPLTGQVSQEERLEEETDKWLREFPELRLIDDATYDLAQKSLDRNQDRCFEFRDAEGKIRGSKRGHSHVARHLLSEIVECAGCGSKMYVGGSFGKYLFCPKAKSGVCEFHSQLQRARAEEKILEAIGKRILANPEWEESIYSFLLEAWHTHLSGRPDELLELGKRIETCERRIKRLVDEIEEAEEPDPDLRERLKDRREELKGLIQRERQLQAEPVALAAPPTREWCRGELSNLVEVLKSSTPAAVDALQGLIDGPIRVEAIPIPNRKRRYWRGTFVLRAGELAKAMLPNLKVSEVIIDAEMTETITIDFRDPTKTDEQGDIAWQMYEAGKQYQEIAAAFGVTVARVTAIMRAAAEKRGVAFPDGRLRKASWAKRYERPEGFVESIIAMGDAGIPTSEIAKSSRITENSVRQMLGLERLRRQDLRTAHGHKVD